jgi:fumarate hydratase class II
MTDDRDRDDDPDAWRIEHDSMGEVRVPASARWGAQTQRAVDNFPVSGRRVPKRLVHALAAVKAEAARVNAAIDEVAAVDDETGRAIAEAAEAVARGDHDDEFPVDVFQTGSGTSTNMNVNEVVASLASERLGRAVHPNDQVNASQSSNDVFPTAMRIAAVEGIAFDLVPALEELSRALRERAGAFVDVVKAGRTHLMDATPVTLGQELGGHASQIEDGIERLQRTLPAVARLPLGGTAVGTGINAPHDFGGRVVAALAARRGLPFVVAPDRFATQSAQDALVELSGQLRTLAVSCVKIANDLRWMASGPRTGLAEIRLPDLQPGSSIMPGKVNPVLPEMLTQVAAEVIGNDATVAFAGSQGSFELNTYLPVIAANVLASIELLTNATRLFATRCVAGIDADEARCRAYAEASPAVVTALNPVLGYERAADAVKAAALEGRSVRDVVLERGWLDAARLDAALDVLALTRGGLHARGA